MHSGSDMKQVLIVEDQPLVAYAMQRLIRAIDDGIEASVCASAECALRMLRDRAGWHRIFLAPHVPGGEGLALVRRMRQLGVAGRCALVTRSINLAWMHEARSAGMLGYLLSTVPVERFTADLRGVLEGRPVFAAVREQPDMIRLTRRQEEILSLLRSGCSSKQIAARLEISEGTVNNHVATLIRLLGVANRTQAIARAMELGYLRWHPH